MDGAPVVAAASPPPYDPLLRSPPSKARRESLTQVTPNVHPVSMDTPTQTPHDLYCLAKEYERRGRLPDAADLYLKAAMNGHLSAMVSYASHLVTSDERAAFVWFRAAAERGDARAWAELGQLLARGRYFEVNAIDAARCWKRAAQMGDNTGKSALGLCYIRGFGVRQDATKGLEILRQVADVHNDVTAMTNLEWIYRYGKGVPKNYEEAEYWESRARKQEQVVQHISSREQALFGRGRVSRHSRHKTRDTDKVSSRPPVSGTTTSRDNVLSEQEQLRNKPSQVTVLDERHSPPSYHRSAEVAPLNGSDINERLKAVSQDPSRYTPEAEQDKDAHHSGSNIELTPSQLRDDESKPSKVLSDAKDAAARRRGVLPAAAVIGAASAAATATALAERVPGNNEHRQEDSGQTGNKALEEFKEHTDAVRDPELGAAVDQLNFKPSGSIEDEDTSGATGFALPASELQAVQDSATVKAAKQALSDETPVVSGGAVDQLGSDRIPGDPDTEAIPREHEPLEESADDQFITPDQSLDADGGDTSGILKPVAAAVAGATAAALGIPTAARTVSRPDEGQGLSGRILGTSGATATGRPDTGIGFSRPARVAGETRLDSAREKVEGVAPDIVSRDSAIDSDSLAPVMQSSAVVPENNNGESSPTTSPPPMQRGNSYSLNGAGDNPAQHGAEDLDELENADMERMTSATRTSQATYNAETPAACKITRASGFSKDSQSPTRQAVENKSPEHDEGGNFSHTNLKTLLSLYPTNPLRADSQVPLFNLLHAVQEIPLSDGEAFGIVEEGHGLPKIVVAMLSQHEDEYLQEQGLHSFVRIIRAAPNSQREAMVLMPYANCYRCVVAKDDVVIPKGFLGVDEHSSGAIQAVVHAMQQHLSVRRVQLAGCAAIAEIAAVSPACRSVAFDHGAVQLIMACLRHRSTAAACTIHDVACRATTTYCSGTERYPFQEAFTNAGAVSGFVSILQLWGHTEDVTSELLTTVTKSCCTAIQQLTDGCVLSSAHCVQSFAYHHLVRTIVLRRKDVSVCTLVVGAMTSITRNAGAIAEKGLQDANPLPEVLVTMQVHESQPFFIRKCLDFMEALANFGSMREEIVAAGGIPFAAEIIQQGGSDSLLLERSCGVAEKLCRSNPKNQETFAANKGISSLTTLLKSHQSNPGVTEKALVALTSTCANNPKMQNEALRVGAPDQVLRTLGTYSSKHSMVAAASAGTMASLVVPRNAPVAQTLAKQKAPELLVRAMKRHPDNSMMQESGSAAIASLCEADPRIISTLLKSGLPSILVVALQTNLHKQSAIIQIARCMRAVSNEVSEDSYRFKTRLLTDRSNESSLAEIFNTALSHHKKSLPDSANVIISICATINRLCMRSVAFKNEIGKDGIVEELKRLIERTAEYRDLGALQPVLATVCTLVLDCEDNKNRFHSVGGVEAILDVMQRWKSDTYVLEHCCAALRYSCNEHFGNCNEVKNHNGVRSILGVMELHPENVNVTLWCCLTLADLCKGDEVLQSSPNVVQGIRKVVSAMTMFSTNGRFLSSACEFLRAASTDNIENQERIVRLGGRNAIIKAMETHPGDANLTEAGAYALLQVQDVHDAQASVDSQPSKGLVQRLSRDLRRSGSSSSRPNRSSGKLGILGRKSRSFTARRKGSEVIEEEDVEVTEEVSQDAPASRPSLLNFSRRSRTRSRRSRMNRSEPEEQNLGPVGHVEEYPAGANDEYGEYGSQPVATNAVNDPIE